jgi:hypothetical protein
MGLATSAASSLRSAEAFERRIEWSIVPGRPNSTVRALASTLPLVAARFGTRDYTRHLKTMLRARDFDVVILDNYAMAWAIAFIQRSERNGTSPLIVYIGHNFETKLSADIARNFSGNLFRKSALYANAWKTATAERNLARAGDIIVTLTAEGKHYRRFFPLLANVDLRTLRTRVQYRQIVPATPRRVVIVGDYRWTPKEMNMSAFSKQPTPSCKTLASVSTSSARRRICERLGSKGQGDAFHGFVEDLGEFRRAALWSCRADRRRVQAQNTGLYF